VFLDPSASVRLYTSPSAVEAALAWERSHAPRARRVALGGSTGTALERAGLPHTRSTTTAGEDVLAALFEGWTPRPRAER
jgi:uroporphyrinogen-III synthase